jgi:hypothetical protein
MKWLTIGLLILSTGACTNHLYQGTTTYQDNDRQCQAMVYWYDMSHWHNTGDKPTTIVVRNASNPSTFNISQDNYLGNKDKFGLVESNSDYVKIIGEPDNDFTDVNCGYFSGKQAHQQGQTNTTEFYLFCNKKARPLHAADTSGLRAQITPYVFNMATPIAKFTWLGELPDPQAVKLSCE